MKCSSTYRFLLIIAAILVGTPYCLAWSLDVQPVEGVLVLRNGNVLRGKIQQQGEYYHVHLANGTLQVREKQVEMFCQNLEEAYQRRRETRGGSTADSHLELAGWCLRHDLFEHVAAELEAAQEIDPDHPRLALQRRQLKHSLQMATREKKIQQAKATVVPEPTPLDPATLEKAPQWARALFVRQIQPLVVHSCAASGCHQSGTKSDFQINRLAIEGAGHPEATLRNLAATLEQINWQAVEQSDLLTRAKLAHGAGTASTPLPAHKLQVLQGWVGQLAEAHRKETKLQSMPLVAKTVMRPVTPTPQINPPQGSSQQASSPVRMASYDPVDPFDPAKFNRRYAKAEKPATEPTVPHVMAPDQPELTPLPASE